MRPDMGITVIGAGLAGCEAAAQAARLGVPVTLIEMKPERTPLSMMCIGRYDPSCPYRLLFRMRCAAFHTRRGMMAS